MNTENCLLPAVNVIPEHSDLLPAVNRLRDTINCLMPAVNMIEEHCQLDTANC